MKFLSRRLPVGVSVVALCWIRGIDKEWKQFVQNRVKEITSLLPVESWRYCPTDSNPADFPLRVSSQLAGNTLWVMGPEWLSHRKEESKSIVITQLILEECLTEMTMKNRGNLKSSTLLVNTTNYYVLQPMRCDFLRT